MTNASELALAVDIGGTKVASGVVDSDGNILFSARVPITVTGSASAALDCVHAAIDAVLRSEFGSSARAIGVASPGPLDLPAGTVLHTPNLPCWKNFPLGDLLRQTYPMPVRVDNDANAAGLAESLWGAGRAYRNVFYVTLGTGIGTAMVLDGKIYYGRTGAAPEGGHMTVDYHAPILCGCGKHGCLESFASGPSIARRVRERFHASVDGSVLKSLSGGDSQRINTEMIVQAWRAGDPLANQVLRETARLLAIWLGNIIDLLEPDVIVVGGGVAKLFFEWIEEIREQIPSWSINERCREIPIKMARYEGNAGIAGAGALCFAAAAQLFSESSINRDNAKD